MNPLIQKKVKQSILALFDNGSIVSYARAEKRGDRLEIVSGVLKGDRAYCALNLNEKSEGAEIITALSSEEVLVRHLTLPLHQRSALVKALPFQMENLLPFALSEAIAIPQIEAKKGGSRITFFAAKRERVRAHLNYFEKFYLYPDRVSAEPQALCRVATYFYPEIDHLYVLFIDSGKGRFLEIERGLILRSIHFPMDDTERAEFELKRLLHHLEEKKATEVPWLVFDREGVAAACLIDAGKWLIELPDEVKGLHECLIAYGLALEGCASDRNRLQFATGEFTPLMHRLKLKKRIRSLFTQIAGSLALIFCVGTLLIKCENRALERSLDGLITRASEELSQIEAADWQGLSFWQKSDKLQKLVKGGGQPKGDTTPFLVSDLLVYLGTHPLLQPNSGIQIQNLHYELVSYPTVKESRHNYLVRVDLSLKAEEPLKANQFYDSLRQGDQLVDPKQEMRWIRNENGYELSFFLKNPR